MSSFFNGIDPQVACNLADISRRMFELREARKHLLAETGCVNADDLMGAMRTGRVPEHPGYEGWLAMRLLGGEEQAHHDSLHWHCLMTTGQEHVYPPQPHGLAALASSLEPALPPTFAGSVQLHLDGLAFRSIDGIDALVRIVSPSEWSFEWCWRDQLWRLDTAPVGHRGVTTRAHLHRPDGTVAEPPMFLPDTGNVALVLALLAAIGRSPTVGQY